jgi:hypothetical protein
MLDDDDEYNSFDAAHGSDEVAPLGYFFVAWTGAGFDAMFTTTSRNLGITVASSRIIAAGRI